ncbi:hypothetical protein GCM10007971_04220 [Oceanobacillus indicireducens]|uniref:Uncharacterized protein n=1 Tax=Oceanobacillus indicireducens TaxID=1004261 RepID=A0A917XRK2_9BACI|nr:hypothetical protein GCM10007971_04220 [Oceanobacillus indicireducens]
MRMLSDTAPAGVARLTNNTAINRRDNIDFVSFRIVNTPLVEKLNVFFPCSLFTERELALIIPFLWKNEHYKIAAFTFWNFMYL